ncbi:MAG TPA: hypothetical protein VG096_02405 [Bryobacteraceae bacterium]|jgi:hypothetical protein|nr:hypothetical protein [Bryobacteraceae bacterium]
MSGIAPATATLILWGVVTALLVALLIYRSLIAMKEDDQLFLDPAASNLEKEQQQVRMRLARLAPYTKILGATSGLLLVATAGLWVYDQFTKPSFLP